MNNDVDFMRIKGGEYGAINFNNMIPVHNSAITPIDVSAVEDVKYKLILINQLKFFDKFETEIINKATKLYKAYQSKTLRKSVADRCCNFGLLESYVKKYNPNYKKKNSNN